MGYPSGIFIPPSITRAAQPTAHTTGIDASQACGLLCDIERGSPSGLLALAACIAIAGLGYRRWRAMHTGRRER